MANFELLPGCALADLEAATWQEVVTTMAERVVDAGHARPEFVAAVLAREERFPTGLPTAVPSAIPHPSPEHVIHAGLAVATLKNPVEFGVIGGSGTTIPVQIVVMLCMTHPTDQVGALQTVLGRLQHERSARELLAERGEGFEEAARRWLAGERPTGAETVD